MDNTQTLQETTDKVTKKSAFMIVAALMLGYSLIYMDKAMISLAIIPMGEQFSLGSSQTGAIMSAFFLGYSLLQIPGGWLADKFGAKKILLLSLGVIALLSFAFGFANSLLLFCIIRCVAGFGHAGYPSSCSKSVAENFPQEKRTFVQALVLSTAGIGGILAFLFGSRLIALDWRLAYEVLGGLFLVAFLAIAFVLPKRSAAAQAQQAGATKVSLRAVFENRTVLTLFVAMLLLNFLLYGVMSWGPTLLSQKFELELTSVSMIFVFNSVVQTVATLSVGRLLSTQFLGKERKFLLVSTSIAGAAVCGLAFINSLPIVILCLYAVSMFSIAAFTCIFTWPHKILSTSMIGSSVGVINTGGTLGGFLAPILLGSMIQSAGGDFRMAFLAMAVASVGAGLVGMGVKQLKEE